MFICSFITSFNDSSNPSFEETLRLLEEEMPEGLNLEYQDLNGDSLMHLVIKSLVNKLAYMHRDFQYRNSVPTNILPYDKENESKNTALQLAKKMLSLGIPFDLRNQQNETSWEILNQARIRYSSIQQILQLFLQVFESKERLFPGRKYLPQNIGFFRSSKHEHKRCEIPNSLTWLDSRDGARLTLHQRLAFYEYLIRLNGMGGGAENLVVANLGFIVSDHPKSDPIHKPVFVSVPIRIGNYITYAESHGYGTHSEGGLFNELINPNNLSSLIKNLKQFHTFQNGQKLYALLLDIVSTREVCKDCQHLLHRLQADYDDQSFLKKLERLAISEGYVLPTKSFIDSSVDITKPKLRLTIRASGLDSPGYSGSEPLDVYPPTVCTDPPLDIKKHPQKILFHLPPRWNPGFSTGFIDNDLLMSYKSQIREQYHQAYTLASRENRNAEIANYDAITKQQLPDIMRNQLFYFKQTAFANTGGHARSISDYKQNSLQSASIEDPKTIKALGRSLII